jgi:hypothetical protein
MSTDTTTTPAAPTRSADRGGSRERGDVPGWVLVTVMTAGIVVALGGVAVPALTGMFEQAVAAVALP